LYSEYCIEIEGCATQGDTMTELVRNMQEVLDLYLDEPEDSKQIIPMPDNSIDGEHIIKVGVDNKIASSMLARQERLQKK